MTNEALQARREYMRRYMRTWRAENKDKVQATQDRFWQRKADAIKAEDGLHNSSKFGGDNRA